ncbi:hypothetical protein Y032_0045g1199 [Ancylostoma ceylanicum]|uniref:Uncharacterized protein n=1 Tax=Ancylostoma ceylanicum TaxID=53326 RepID=A0A016UDQ7_9BILA|nr:hypothetical protein Y032_0045g1199 [Ancylostoma ceylanicum]
METLQTARATLDQLRTARNDIDEASQRKGQGQVQANQTSKVTTDQLKTARNDGDEASHRKRRVVVYTKQTYQRNVQTSSSDPKALLKDSTRQSVRLIPLPIDNPQVHTMQKHMDTQIINGKQVNVEHRNEEMMKEDFRQHVLANSS